MSEQEVYRDTLSARRNFTATLFSYERSELEKQEVLSVVPKIQVFRTGEDYEQVLGAGCLCYNIPNGIVWI